MVVEAEEDATIQWLVTSAAWKLVRQDFSCFELLRKVIL